MTALRNNMTGDWGLAAQGVAFGPALPFVAAGASLASGVLQGMGGYAANKFQAQQAERAAQIGKIKANDTDTAMRQELQTTLGNIQAIRAATGSEWSPTEQAVMDEQRRVSDRERSIRVFNIRSQARADEDAASFYSSAANTALFGGALGGLANAAGKLV